MRILALETSGTGGSVAALDAGVLLGEVSLDPTARSARMLAPLMRQLLVQVEWQPRDVQLVAVTSGPGSFTGLRIGLATAKVFAYAAGAAVLGVNTLEALAEQAPVDAQGVQAVIDAQRQEVFASRWPTAPAIISIDTWLASLTPGDAVIGPVLAKLRDRLPPHVRIAPEASWTPMAATVGRIAHRHYTAGQREDVFQLAPLYLRRSAAEEKADANARPGSGG